MDERDSLPQSKILRKRTLGDIFCRRVRVERKVCGVRKDSVVDVCVFYDGPCVMPFAVKDKPDAQQGRCSEEGLERGDDGGQWHRAASSALGDCFGR